MARRKPSKKQENRSIVPAKYKAQYGKAGNTGDELAEVLREFTHGEDAVDPNALAKVKKQNAIDPGKWSSLNVGQQRMNLGNVLRGRIKRGEFVQVGDQIWNEEAKKPSRRKAA